MFIIAEIGLNHNGDMAIAKRLIDVAKRCGCDAVKFQKRTIDIVYTPEFLDSPRESPWGKTQRAQKEGLEFGREQYDEIDAYCRNVGIEWFASAWDIPSSEFLDKYNPRHSKIASPMLTHAEFVKKVAIRCKHTFISTGMSSTEQIEKALEIFKFQGIPFTLLHCISTYPMKDEDANLRTIPFLRNYFKCDVGYSGHETGIAISLAAAALGATVIERHITLDRAMYGSDQAASLEPSGLEQLVGGLRKVERSLGDGVKRIIPDEEKNAAKLRYWK